MTLTRWTCGDRRPSKHVTLTYWTCCGIRPCTHTTLPVCVLTPPSDGFIENKPCTRAHGECKAQASEATPSDFRWRCVQSPGHPNRRGPRLLTSLVPRSGCRSLFGGLAVRPAPPALSSCAKGLLQAPLPDRVVSPARSSSLAVVRLGRSEGASSIVHHMHNPVRGS